MYYLLGIDDTDAPGQEGTPRLRGGTPSLRGGTPTLAYTLGLQLEARGLAQLVNISNHQLMQHPSIAHTSNNVCCCVLMDTEVNKIREIEMLSREILLHESAPNSNPGYALAAWSQFDPDLVAWGKTAKIKPLLRQEAVSLGRQYGISLAGITGSGAGVIGALAAIGLRYEGNDGWVSWMPGLDRLNGIYTQAQLSQIVRFDRIESDLHQHPAMDDRIHISEDVRPLLKDGKTFLSIKPAKKGSEFAWQV